MERKRVGQREYKGFVFSCKTKEQEEKMIAYIDSIGENPTELPDVSEENYAEWKSDFDFDGVEFLYLPLSIKRIGKCVFAQSKIKKLIAPGVLEIDELAFYNTKEIGSVWAPVCVVLAQDCFNHCCASKIEVPKVQNVGRYCFYDAPKIKELDLPECKRVDPHAIYGCENLERVDLGEIEHAGPAIATMNPKLVEIKAKSLKTCHELAFVGNAKDCALRCWPQPKIEHADIEPEELDERAVKTATQTRSVVYWSQYRGVCYSFVDDTDSSLSEEDLEKRETEMHKLIDQWKREGAVCASKNAGANESAESVLKDLKCIYLPTCMKKIGDYAFAKCYALESVEAPGVEEVGDHAFYCDENLSNVCLPNCKILRRDAFNGAAPACDAKSNIARLFLPKVKAVCRHAFWQTGFVCISVPECEEFEQTAIEENPILQKVVAKNILCKNAITSNPNLSVVETSGKVADGAICGSAVATQESSK